MSVSSFLPTKTRSVASSAVTGRRTAVKASITCERASAPALAVSAGGQPSVSSGSQMAVCGMRCGLEMPTLLTRSGSVSTATGVTSDPVPAVVGRATTGMHGTGHAELAVVVGRLAAVREDHGDGLGQVEAAAAAHADHDVRVDAGRELGALSRPGARGRRAAPR